MKILQPVGTVKVQYLWRSSVCFEYSLCKSCIWNVLPRFACAFGTSLSLPFLTSAALATRKPEVALTVINESKLLLRNLPSVICAYLHSDFWSHLSYTKLMLPTVFSLSATSFKKRANSYRSKTFVLNLG